MVQVLEALRDKEAGTYGMSFPLSSGDFVMTRFFGLRMAQEGGQWFDEDGNVAFNSPEGVAAMQWWKDFYDKGLVVPGSFSETGAMTLEFVATGQVASAIDGPFIWSKARQHDPDIRLAYAPTWQAKTGGYSWDCVGMAINPKSTHKEEVWEFFRHIYSEPVAIEMTHATGFPWATKAAIASLENSDNPMLRPIPAMANQDPEHNVFFPLLPEAAKLTDAFLLAFQQVMEGKKDPQTALNEAAAIWQQEIDKVK